MAKRRNPSTKNTGRGRIKSPPFDEADWVDWDHWQTVEEIQNFMNGLADGNASNAGVWEDHDHSKNVANQIRRHGLQAGG
jgi:hypothetical protein